MRANTVLGIIFSNSYDAVLPELTDLRTMGSVPFAGRYRLIDFPLSSMVNAGVNQVGVITKSNYRSLMDHLGTGKPWDLSRKNNGMFLLPPFSTSHNVGMYRNRLDALQGIQGFITESKKEYVLLCDSNIISNMDVADMLEQHVKRQADITIAHCGNAVPELDGTLAMTLDADSRVTHCAPASQEQQDGEVHSIFTLLIGKSLLERLIQEAPGRQMESVERDIIARNVKDLKIYGYALDGFVRTIDSLNSYFDISMELLQPKNRRMLFDPQRVIYTKVRDEVPAIYGLEAKVRNSLIADGCKIEGRVENSILHRGVTISKGAVVRNAIVMQDAFVGQDADLEYVLTDKQVCVQKDHTLKGTVEHPLYISKGMTV